MSNWTLSVALEGSLGNLGAVMAQGAAAVQNFGRTVDGALSGVKTSYAGIRGELGSTLFSAPWVAQNEQHLTRVGTAVAGFGAVVLTGIGFAAKAAIDWESAWAGVEKTTDATAAQLPALEAGLRSMTQVLPASHAEIAAVAEAAGQLGIKSGDVLDFTRVMIDLGESTNVTSDAAATAIAQISNVFGEGFPISEVENFGSALVALGNDGASTEAQILDIAQRMSGMSNVAGMSVQDTLAFANAVASVGINAEVGGSSMSRLMASMSKAVQTGSEDLTRYAEASGVTAEQFAAAWRERPAEAISMFVAGLGRMNEEGGNTMGVLSDLKLAQVGLSQTILSLAGSGDLLNDSLALSSEAWEENSALAEEAGKRYETTESKIQIAKNQLVEVGISIGDTVLPMLAAGAEAVSQLLAAFAGLPEPVQRVVSTLGLLVGVAATVGGGMLLVIPKIAALRTSLVTLRDEVPKTTSAMGRIGKAFGVVGAVIAIGQIAGAMVNASKSTDLAEASLAKVKNLAEAGDWQRVINTFGDVRTGNGLTEELTGLAGAMELLVGSNFDSRFERIGQGLNNFLAGGALPSQVGDAEEKFARLSTTLGEMAASGNTQQAAEGFRMLAAEAERSGKTQEQLLGLLPEYRDALYQVATAQGLTLTDTQLLALANGELASSGLDVTQMADVQAAAMEKTAAAAGMTAEEYEKAQEAAMELLDALTASVASFVDANGTFTSMLGEGETAWESYKDGVSVSIDQLNAKLAEQVEAQTNWSTNLLSLAGTLSQETLAYLQSLGVEGAPLVQQLFKEMTEGNTEALAQFDANVQQMVGIAPMAMADAMLRAAPLVNQVAQSQGQDAANALAAGIMSGQVNVDQAAKELGLRIETLPDGTFTVVADTAPAEEAIDELPADAAATEATVPVDAEMQAARDEVLNFTGEVQSAEITAPVTASYAEAENGHAAFLQYVADVKPMVYCDADTGQATVSVDAFKAYVAALDPEATVGANTDPATGVTTAFITWADGSRSEVAVDANDGTARTTVKGFLDNTNRSTGTVTIAAGEGPARASLASVLFATNTSRGTMSIAADGTGAFLTRDSVVNSVNASSGSVKVSTAKSGGWLDAVSSVLSAINNSTGYVKVSTTGGGGVPVNRRAGGGAVYGPGTTTSDSIPAIGPGGTAWALSNNEHVLPANEVDLMGGQAGVYAWRRMLTTLGRIPGLVAAGRGLRDGGAVDVLRPPYPGSGQGWGVMPTVNVNVPDAGPSNVTYEVKIGVENLAGLRTLEDFVDLIDVHAGMRGRSRPGSGN